MSSNLELHPSSITLVKQLEELWHFSELSMRGKSFQTRGDLRLIILLQITAVTSRTVDSAIKQISGGSFYSLDFLLRPLVEGLINYMYIKDDATQTNARAFIADDIRTRLANVRRLIPLLEREVDPGMLKVTELENYKQLEAELVKEKDELVAKYGILTFPHIEVRAREGNAVEIYSTVYWLLCQDAHLTARGLDRYMKEENGKFSITWDLSIDRFNMALKSFYIIFSALLAECSEKCGVPNIEELDKIEKKYNL